MRRLLIPAIALLLVGSLQACGGKHVAYTGERVRSSASAGHLPDGSGGHYKTGKPYHVAGQWYYPLATAAGYDETGIASWYGRDFHGKTTANGERYDMHAFSAAHKTLPLPTLVRVTNLENGRSIIVRVNDRGPFVKSRLIDLSYAAANALGYANKGTARVRVQTLDVNPPARPLMASRSPAPQPAVSRPVIRRPAPATSRPSMPSIVTTAYASEAPAHPKGGIYIQLGAFGTRNRAEQILNSLHDRYPATFIQPLPLSGRTLYRVRIGPIEDMHRIEQTMVSLQNQGYTDAIVVIE